MPRPVPSLWWSGGTRNGTIVHWSNGIGSKNEPRHQFAHVIDIAPTVLRAAGIPEPVKVNGSDQHPDEGFELNDTFDDEAAEEVHQTQYFEMSDAGASGTIAAQGGRYGGWTTYLTTDGRPAYCYNLFGLQLFKVVGDEPVSAGEHQVRMEFDYDGGGPGQGGTATLYVDGTKVAQGRVENTVPGVFSADETTDVGTDTATGVTDDLDKSNVEFTGDVKWVQIDLGDASQDFDHMITPEERYRIAMARQ